MAKQPGAFRLVIHGHTSRAIEHEIAASRRRRRAGPPSGWAEAVERIAAARCDARDAGPRRRRRDRRRVQGLRVPRARPAGPVRDGRRREPRRCYAAWGPMACAPDIDDEGSLDAALDASWLATCRSRKAEALAPYERRATALRLAAMSTVTARDGEGPLEQLGAREHSCDCAALLSPSHSAPTPAPLSHPAAPGSRRSAPLRARAACWYQVRPWPGARCCRAA